MSGLSEFVLALLVGVATGVLSGMFGVGGAMVSTPGIRALGATPLQAVGSTLPSVVPSSISGTIRYARAGLIRWDVFWWVAPTGIVASVGGALLTTVIPGNGHPLMLATAALVGFTAIRLGRPVRTVEVNLDPTAAGASASASAGAAPAPRTEVWRLLVVGLAAGALSGLLGIGGGLLLVPVFVGTVRLPLKVALGTSLACVGVLAIPGTITHALLGHIDWSFAIPLAIGVVPGAQLGAMLAIRASDRALRISVAVVLGTIAVVYFAGELRALVTG
ncbi:MAG: sulfite exporter TauE/SafE family protein [Actinomycetes bacterium]